MASWTRRGLSDLHWTICCFGTTAYSKFSATYFDLLSLPLLNMYRFAQHTIRIVKHELRRLIINAQSSYGKPTFVGCTIRLCFPLFIMCGCFSLNLLGKIIMTLVFYLQFRATLIGNITGISAYLHDGTLSLHNVPYNWSCVSQKNGLFVSLTPISMVVGIRIQPTHCISRLPCQTAIPCTIYSPRTPSGCLSNIKLARISTPEI